MVGFSAKKNGYEANLFSRNPLEELYTFDYIGENTMKSNNYIQSCHWLPTISSVFAKIFVLSIFAFQPAIADNSSDGYGGDAEGGNGDTSRSRVSLLAPVNEALGMKAYAQAILLLDEIVADHPENADVLNLLGFSHRKVGKLDEAFTYYHQALEINPRHRGAHEYLGELYLQVDDLPKAERQLAILDDLCFFTCKQIKQLRKAIAVYKGQ